MCEAALLDHYHCAADPCVGGDGVLANVTAVDLAAVGNNTKAIS